MNYLRALSIAFCVFISSLSFADEATTQALRILEVSNTEAQMQQMMSQMLDLQLRSKPTLTPYKETLLQFMQKYLGYDILKDEFVKVYADTFTTDELRQIADFRSSDVGLKASKLLPSLTLRVTEIAIERIKANSDELNAMIEAETDRIRKLQSQ